MVYKNVIWAENINCNYSISVFVRVLIFPYKDIIREAANKKAKLLEIVGMEWLKKGSAVNNIEKNIKIPSFVTAEFQQGFISKS